MALRQIVNGGFQDAAGNPLALGSLTFRLQQDTSNGSAQTVAGRLITVPLDANGNVSGTVSLAPTDVMIPAGTPYAPLSYAVIAYTSAGQPVWQNPKFLLPSGGTPYSLG